MSKSYLEIEFRVPPRAFLLESTNHPWFIDQISKYGWEVLYDPENAFDLVVGSESGIEVELFNGEWLVLFADENDRFNQGEAYSPEEFGRFVTK